MRAAALALLLLLTTGCSEIGLGGGEETATSSQQTDCNGTTAVLRQGETRVTIYPQTIRGAIRLSASGERVRIRRAGPCPERVHVFSRNGKALRFRGEDRQRVVLQRGRVELEVRTGECSSECRRGTRLAATYDVVVTR